MASLTSERLPFRASPRPKSFEPFKSPTKDQASLTLPHCLEIDRPPWHLGSAPRTASRRYPAWHPERSLRCRVSDWRCGVAHSMSARAAQGSIRCRIYVRKLNPTAPQLDRSLAEVFTAWTVDRLHSDARVAGAEHQCSLLLTPGHRVIVDVQRSCRCSLAVIGRVTGPDRARCESSIGHSC